jgi:hypothetical protein
LLSIICFARYYLLSDRTAGQRYLIFSILSYILALGSKEPAVEIPVILTGVCFYLHLTGVAKEQSRSKALSLVIFFLIIPLYLLVRKLVLPGSEIGLVHSLSNILAIPPKIAYYLRDLISPIDLSWLRSFMYNHGLVIWAIILSIIIAAVFVVVFLARFLHRPLVMSCFLWIVFTLIIPVLAPFAPMRRHLYFPLVGFALLLPAIAGIFKRRFLAVFAIMIYIALSAWTVSGRVNLFRISGNAVRDGLVDLQKELPQVSRDSVICLTGIPGVLKNTPSFWAAPTDKIRLLYLNSGADIFCATVITFTEGSIKDSHFEWIDDYNFVESLESNIDEYIRVPGISSGSDDRAWKKNSEGKGEYKVIGKNRFGEAEVVAFRFFPETIKGKEVYIVSPKEGRLRVVKKYRVN